jgi:hypothetical protein
VNLHQTAILNPSFHIAFKAKAEEVATKYFFLEESCENSSCSLLPPPPKKRVATKLNKGCKELQKEIKTEYPQIENLNKNFPTAAVYFRREESSSGSRERRRAPKTNSLATE